MSSHFKTHSWKVSCQHVKHMSQEFANAEANVKASQRHTNTLSEHSGLKQSTSTASGVPPLYDQRISEIRSGVGKGTFKFRVLPYTSLIQTWTYLYYSILP